MNREEILASAKENKERGKEFERQEKMRGDTIASYIGLLIGIAMIVAELWIKKQFNYGVCAIVFLVTSIQSLNEGIKLHKWWLVCLGIFEGLVSLLMLFMFIWGLLN